jgi:DNA-binding LacI/PurR family transcriptional regulator
MRIDIIDSRQISVYRQIAVQIKQHIVDNRLEYGVAIPTVSEVAKIANVSIRTADLGISELVKEGICFRIPKRGTFVSDLSKKDMNKRKAFGVFVPKSIGNIDNDNAVLSSIYRGLTSEADICDMDLIILKGEVESSIDFYRSNNSIDFKGVIIAGENIPNVHSAATKYSKLPFIHLNYLHEDFFRSPDNVHGIFNDDFGGAYQIMNVMLDKGHRNVLIISLKVDDDNYRNRVDGFLSALANSDLETDNYLEEHNLKDIHNFSHIELARHITRTYVEDGKKIDLVMCVDDLLADGVVAQLNDLGRNDVEVCGYDNVIPDSNRKNKYSTVAIDFEKMGRQAVKILNAPDKNYPKSMKIMPVLIPKNQAETKKTLIGKS